jgi:putative SOS response-associated peptidase YedK
LPRTPVDADIDPSRIQPLLGHSYLRIPDVHDPDSLLVCAVASIALRAFRRLQPSSTPSHAANCSLHPTTTAAPQDWHPVIRLNEDGEREIVNTRWGFLSKEAKTEKSVKTPINARAESILTTWPFTEAIRYRRCMVPVNGFYEWVRPESRPDDCPA